MTGDGNHNDIAATYAATATISNATITVNAPNQSYTFTEKWNPEKDKVTSDIMLYAKWEKQKEETPTTTEAPATTEETTETTTETTIVPDTKVDTPEANVETPKSDTPKAPTTGDKMNIGVIVMLMIDSVLAGLYLTLRRRLMK